MKETTRLNRGLVGGGGGGRREGERELVKESFLFEIPRLRVRCCPPQFDESFGCALVSMPRFNDHMTLAWRYGSKARILQPRQISSPPEGTEIACTQPFTVLPPHCSP